MSAVARSTDAGALLARTQQQLERLYGIEAPHGVEAFLLADPALAAVLHGPGWTPTVEMLLVREEAGDLELSLFLDAALLARLSELSPHDELSEENLDDFWSLVEGVSHFVYRDANRYAGRYCLALQRAYLERRRAGLLDELRSFYREDRSGKLARIGQP